RFHQGADGFLVRAIASLGPVQAVDQPLARYRRHGDNDSEIGSSPARLALAFRKRIAMMRTQFEIVKQLADEHGLFTPEDLGEQDPDYPFMRLCSLAVEPESHPLPADSRLGVAARFLAAQWRTGSPVGRRLAVAGLASAIAVLPRPLRSPLLGWWHTAAARPTWLVRLTAWRRWPRHASACR